VGEGQWRQFLQGLETTNLLLLLLLLLFFLLLPVLEFLHYTTPFQLVQSFPAMLKVATLTTHLFSHAKIDFFTMAFSSHDETAFI
jgi:hypothetical protein